MTEVADLVQLLHCSARDEAGRERDQASVGQLHRVRIRTRGVRSRDQGQYGVARRLAEPLSPKGSGVCKRPSWPRPGRRGHAQCSRLGAYCPRSLVGWRCGLTVGRCASRIRTPSRSKRLTSFGKASPTLGTRTLILRTASSWTFSEAYKRESPSFNIRSRYEWLRCSDLSGG